MAELLSSEKVKYGDSVHNARRFIDEEGYPYGVKHTSNRPHVTPYVWDTVSLSFVAQTQTSLVTGSLTVSGTMDLTKIGGAAVGVSNPLFTSTKTPLTPQSPAQVSVDLVSEELVAANATRTGMIVVNTS